MKTKKLISVITAFALTMSMMAGLGSISVSAAKTNVVNEDFESGSTDVFTPVTGGASAIGTDAATTNAKTGNIYAGKAAGSESRTTNSKALGITSGGLIEFDFRIDSSNSNQTSSLFLSSVKETKNWIDASNGKQALLIQSTTTDGNTANTKFSVNGVEIPELKSNDTTEGTFRSTTGWIHMCAVVNANAHKMNLTLTRTSTGVEIYSQTIDFLNAVDAIEYLSFVPGRGYGGIFIDNLVVDSLAMPALSYTAPANVTVGSDAVIPVTASNITGGITVSSNSDKLTAVYNEGNITLSAKDTVVAGDTATVTITAVNDIAEETVTESFEVALVPEGAGSHDITIKYVDAKDGTTELKTATTVQGIVEGARYVATEEEKTGFLYTDQNGIEYDAVLSETSDVSITSSEGAVLALKFDLTEKQYEAAVTTVRHAEVKIEGTSKTNQNISTTVYSDSAGTASVQLPVGDNYTVTVTKGGYTSAQGTLAVTKQGGSAMVDMTPVTAGTLLYEDFATTGISDNGYGLFGGMRKMSGNIMQLYSDSGRAYDVPVDGSAYDSFKVVIDQLMVGFGDRNMTVAFSFKNGEAELFKLTAARVTDEGGVSTTTVTISSGETSQVLAEAGYDGILELYFSKGKVTGTWGEKKIELALSADSKITNLSFALARQNSTNVRMGGVEIYGYNAPEITSAVMSTNNTDYVPSSAATGTKVAADGTETAVDEAGWSKLLTDAGTITTVVMNVSNPVSGVNPVITTTDGTTYEAKAALDGNNGLYVYQFIGTINLTGATVSYAGATTVNLQ